MNVDKLVDIMCPVVRSAGAMIMEVYRRDPEEERKSDGSPVTEADRLAERIIVSELARHAPDVPVVSEETSSSHLLEPRRSFFLVDPLDGTKEFLKRDGKGSFTVNVALIENGAPIAGIVLAPALGRLFVGILGSGARELSGAGNARSLRVRAPPKGGLVAVASASHRDPETDAWLSGHGIGNTISIGSSLKFCLVAAGEADVYPRFGPTMEWDTAAGDAVLRAAGGKVTSPGGAVLVYGKSNYRNDSFVAWGAESLPQANV